MPALALDVLRWLRRTGVELRLVYADGSWRLGMRYPDGTHVLLVAPALSDHLRMLGREMRRAA